MNTRRLTQAAVAASAIALLMVGISSATAATTPAYSLPELVSQTTTGQPGDILSSSPSISADGRFIAFVSKSQNLSPTPVDGRTPQVYLRDTELGTTTLISKNAQTEAPGDFASGHPSISADGDVVAYVSQATNIVAGPTNGQGVFVWDRAGNTTTNESVSSAPANLPSDGNIYDVALSGDASAVVFSSTATNLTSEDTHGHIQVFARRLRTGVTSLVSVDTRTTTPAGAPSGATMPSISSDGNRVGFLSLTSVVPTSDNGYAQMFLRDLTTLTTEMVSVNNSGAPSGGKGTVLSGSVSPDGRFAVFSDTAEDITDTSALEEEVYLRSLDTKTSKLVSSAPDGSAVLEGATTPVISQGGTVVTFASNSPRLVPGAMLPPGVSQIFSVEINSSRITVISEGPSRPGTGDSSRPVISADGAAVAFESTASNLITDSGSDSTSVQQVFAVGAAQIAPTTPPVATPSPSSTPLPTPETTAIAGKPTETGGGEAPSTHTNRTLANTGASAQTYLVPSAILLVVGVGFVIAVSRRRRES